MHSSGADRKKIAGMLEDGSMKVHIDTTFPFGEIAQAHSVLENGKVKGKIVITLE